jgi:hypothetical protein
MQLRMASFLLVPVVLSSLLAAAHLLRSLGPLGALAALLPLLLLAVRKPGSARALQALLVLAALEWVRALAVLKAERDAVHAPAQRMVVILGVVALFTAASALVFQAQPLLRRFHLRDQDAS